jgi:hypothetical protein
MTRIAKKKTIVKRQTKAKAVKIALRYVIRKDSLDRRYAVNKATGQRVSLYRAEQERKEHRQALKLQKPVKRPKNIPRNKIIKPRKVTGKAKKPSKRNLAAKKGWATRKAKALARSEAAKKGWETRRKAREIVPISTLTPPETLPPELEVPYYLVPLESLRERMALYPNVKRAAEDAFTRLQLEAWTKRANLLEGKPSPKMTRDELLQSNIRDLIAERIRDPGDADRVLTQLCIQFNGEWPLRELYHLYFSPDVA